MIIRRQRKNVQEMDVSPLRSKLQENESLRFLEELELEAEAEILLEGLNKKSL